MAYRRVQLDLRKGHLSHPGLADAPRYSHRKAPSGVKTHRHQLSTHSTGVKTHPPLASKLTYKATRQKPRLIEIIQNLRERIREAQANGWLGEVEGLQVSFDAAMAKLNSLKNTLTDGRPQLVDLGVPVFTDAAPLPRPKPGEPELRS